MSDITLHFEGIFFAAAGVGTVVLSLILAAISATFSYTNVDRRSGRSKAGRVLFAASACFFVGLCALLPFFLGGHDEAGYALRDTLDSLWFLVPTAGIGGWAAAWFTLAPKSMPS